MFFGSDGNRSLPGLVTLPIMLFQLRFNTFNFLKFASPAHQVKKLAIQHRFLNQIRLAHRENIPCLGLRPSILLK